MVKKYTNIYCDVCASNGREVLGSHFGNVPVWFTNDDTIRHISLDLCEACKAKITTLTATATYKGTIYTFKDEQQS